MKTKSSRKTTKAEIIPPPNSAAIQGEAVPPGLEFFAELKDKSHAEQVAAVTPKFAAALKTGDEKALGVYAALFSGVGIDVGIKIPLWAKAASQMFWQAISLDFLARLPDGQPSDVGKFCELVQLAPQKDNPSRLDQTVQTLVQLIKSEAANLPADKNLEFAKGRMNAGKVIERMKGLPQRSKIYAVIAVAWCEVEKFESAAQLHNWLLKQGVIVSSTDAAETRKVCRIIGLQLRAKAGRPPDKK
jgi:hypothetical protein